MSRIIRVHSAKGAVYARIMEAMMLPGSDEPMYAVIDTVDVPEGLDQAGAVAYFRSQGWEVQEDVGGDFDHPEWVEAGRSAVVKTCPDCAAVPQGNRIAHVDTCPIGRGIDEICADDRAFFEANPGATERRRSPHWAEGADLKVMGYMVDAPGEWAGEVVVRPIAEGVRARDLSGVFFVPSGVPEGWERPQMPEVGENENEPPFAELPYEVAVEVDKVIAAGTPGEFVWEGRALIAVPDTFIAQAAEEAGKTVDEATSGGWRLERGDGRYVYIWRAPRQKGRYGLGKPTRPL